MSGHESHLAGLAVIAVLALAFEVRCGARTPLPLGQPCAIPGTKQSCSDNCGVGEETCQATGFWGMCVVPPAFRACSNACGNGRQTCVGGMWSSSCDDVPVTTRRCASVCGAGTETCLHGDWQPCNAPPPGPPTLQATVRYFLVLQPDFYYNCCQPSLGPGPTTGIVAFNLGADGKPVYVANPSTPDSSTHGATDFDEWYNDVSGINASVPYSLVFTAPPEDPGQYVFDNEVFYAVDDPSLPIDGGFGINHDFTLEADTQILYTGGETYSFASDDDLWVFINRRLAVDLGGLHATIGASVELDAVADRLGIVKGQTYPLDLFYANRQPPGAVLMISIPTTDIWACPQ
jgi:fibro-slime domain-containing protein